MVYLCDLKFHKLIKLLILNFYLKTILENINNFFKYKINQNGRNGINQNIIRGIENS